ncbi:MAG TPA: CTP synthase [Rhodanobacteraceae bacterium]|nr:CTP synthase [Rhodanobacteraceae bacterium]
MMPTPLRVGLIGDRDDTVTAHRAIPVALRLAGEASGTAMEATWVPTERAGGGDSLVAFDGFWCVPASPYRSMEGALRAIRTARERGIPFLGTCGGFQHAILEYARNALGWRDAEHAEVAPPEASRPVIVPLLCSLVEVTATVQLAAGSRLHLVYGAASVAEGYHCGYGLSGEFRRAIEGGPLHVTAVDAAGDVRGVELANHPFFVATLFQPERGALVGRVPPPVRAFVRSMLAAA